MLVLDANSLKVYTSVIISANFTTATVKEKFQVIKETASVSVC